MTDSSSFSSLMALVDNHLSKTSLQTNAAEDTSGLPSPTNWKLPNLTSASETLSDTRLSMGPSQSLPLPTLSLTENPIQEVLAMQVNNMLKAKEKPKQQDEEVAEMAQEREKLAEEMRKLQMQDDNDCVIDLVKAVNESMSFKQPTPEPPKDETISSSSSYESQSEPKFIDCNREPDRAKSPEPLLPCKNDMSYILKEKVRQGRCSSFGKVLTSRLRPVAAPYMKEKVHTKVVRFDFTTKSPCDMIKEKLRQPQPYASHMYDIFTIFPDLDT